MNIEILGVGLPKWPALAVSGQSVSPQLAAEILIRTDSWYFGCNDHRWNAELCRAADIRLEEHGFMNYDDLDLAKEKYRVLDLEYLSNHRIASSWIGGPYGWCHWDGSIGSSNYNIGKWPSVGDVFEEWKKIATAFPQLSLKSQIYNGETCEENIRPVVEFQVIHGEVSVYEPAAELPVYFQPMRDITDVRGERGCTIKQFKDALVIVEKNR